MPSSGYELCSMGNTIRFSAAAVWFHKYRRYTDALPYQPVDASGLLLPELSMAHAITA
jgi:hypothetical protein